MGERRSLYSSILLVAAIFLVLVVIGSIAQSSPSQAVLDKPQKPTTTTTTEPPPEGVVVVELRNGSFSPANLKLDLTKAWIVKWINTDPVDVRLFDASREKLFDLTLTGNGGTFEWDYSELPVGIWRYKAEVGRNQIPGQIDTRPEQ